MTPPVINYARMQRLEAAEIPPPSRWDMTKCTKFCLCLMIIAFLILFKRWRDKADSRLRQAV